MKANEIKVGGRYIAKVNGGETEVRVDAIRPTLRVGGRERTVYDVTNMRTDRKTVFRSASKFRRLATDATRKAAADLNKTLDSITEYPMSMSEKTKSVLATAKKAPVQVGRDLVMEEVNAILLGRSPVPTPPKVERPLPPMKSKTQKSKSEDSPPSDPVYAEIREFEAKIGRRWWKDTGAEKMESWESFKKRGCPLTPVLPVSPTPQATQERVTTTGAGESPSDHRYPGLSGSGVVKTGVPLIASVTNMGGTVTPIPKKDKAPREPGAPSNKEIVYKEWLKSLTPPDLSAVAALVPDVQMSTVKSWMGAWAKGAGFPACAKELPPSLRGSYGKEVQSPVGTKTKSPKGRK